MEIALKNVSKRFGAGQVLTNFSFTVPPRQITCLFGPSGCGKTTLLRLIAGLEQADDGLVTGFGEHKVGIVFQEHRLLPWRTAQQNIEDVIPQPKKLRAQLAIEWLCRVGLAGSGEKYPDELSGGMCQRVALARALAFGADVILLDEPFKGVDEAQKAELLRLVRAQTAGKTALFVTHQLDEARALSDEIVYLQADPLTVVNRERTGLPKE